MTFIFLLMGCLLLAEPSEKLPEKLNLTNSITGSTLTIGTTKGPILLLWSNNPDEYMRKNWWLTDLSTYKNPIVFVNTGKESYKNPVYATLSHTQGLRIPMQGNGFAFYNQAKLGKHGNGVPTLDLIEQNLLKTMDLSVFLVVTLGIDGIVAQKSNADCGHACAAMVIERLSGKSATEMIYANYPDPPQNPLSLLEIKQILEGHGYWAEGYRGTLANLIADGSGYILHFGGDHFLVFVQHIDNGIILLDPRVGRIAMSRSEFKKNWNGVYLHVKNKP